MTTRTLLYLLTLGTAAAGAALVLSSPVTLQANLGSAHSLERQAMAGQASAGDPLEAGATLRVASGQYITPTAANGSVQQLLNPLLPNYPDFVAGMAVRSRLSP